MKENLKENPKENPKEKTCPFPAEGCYYKGSANTCTRGEEQCLHPARVNPKHWEELNTKTSENVNSEKVVYNGAKVREALENARSLIYKGIATEVDDAIDHPFHLELAIEKIESALSAPPRNCDTMNWRDAWEKWKLEARPATPVTYKECYESTAAFMDWYTSAKGGAE